MRSRTTKYKILIVDDHPMMRLGLRQFLSQEQDFTICGEAPAAAQALAAIERDRPDIVLLDVSLEGRSGLDLLHDLRVRFPDLKVLVHSMHDELIYADRALAAGARGYLMKQESGGNLMAAIRLVLSGGTYLGESLRPPGNGRSRLGRNRPTGQTPIATLTPREFEVFQHIGSGCVNREIARQLHVSVKTVDAHREHIKRKLNLASSTALNLLAVRWQSEQAASPRFDPPAEPQIVASRAK